MLIRNAYAQQLTAAVDANILPTPMVGMLGVIDDVADRVKAGFRNPGDVILLLGDTFEDIDGSAWAETIHSHLGGRPPVPDFAAEKALAQALIQASKLHLLSSAHDLSDGGLAQALAESCFRGKLGASIELPDDPFVALFSETPGRVLVSLPEANLQLFTALCQDIVVTQLGVVNDSENLVIKNLFELDLEALRNAWSAVIPDALHS